MNTNTALKRLFNLLFDSAYKYASDCRNFRRYTEHAISYQTGLKSGDIERMISSAATTIAYSKAIVAVWSHSSPDEYSDHQLMQMSRLINHVCWWADRAAAGDESALLCLSELSGSAFTGQPGRILKLIFKD